MGPGLFDCLFVSRFQLAYLTLLSQLHTLPTKDRTVTTEQEDAEAVAYFDSKNTLISTTQSTLQQNCIIVQTINSLFTKVLQVSTYFYVHVTVHRDVHVTVHRDVHVTCIVTFM
jgi:hypothetical protein